MVPCSLLLIQGSSSNWLALGLTFASCCKHLSMKLWHSSDTSVGISGRSMFASRLCSATCTLPSPSSRVPHGLCPVSISTTRQPRDQMSDRLPTFCMCVSGAIQAGELQTSEFTLRRLLELADRSVDYCGAFKRRELPMSHNLISFPS